MTQLFGLEAGEEAGDVVRHGGFEINFVLGARMKEPEGKGVDGLAPDPGRNDPIKGVAQNGVAEVAHVDPDLMRAAGLGTDLQKRGLGKPLEHAEKSQRLFAAGGFHNDFFPV